MDTGSNKIVDRSARRTGVQLTHEALESDIRRSSSGDARAAGRILTELADEDRHLQSRIGAQVVRTADRDFWTYLLEFASLGTWSGQKVALPETVTPRTLRARIAGLVLSRQDAVSAPGRSDALVAATSHPDAGTRRFALELLCRWQPGVQPEAIVPLLHDPDLGVRVRATRVLGRLEDGRAVPALIEILAHTDDLIAGEAAEALARIGEPALGPLTEALQHRDAHVRWHAAKSLAEMHSPEAADALIAALHDQDFGVRWFAAEGLVAIGTPAIRPLLRALRGEKMTAWLADGAIHVFKNTKDSTIIGLTADLEKRLYDSYANVEVPIEADRILRKLEETYQA